MDALNRALDTVRMQTAVFCTAELTSPWSLRSRPLEFGIFHAIVSGECWAEVDVMEPRRLRAGDAVVIPHGSGHVMTHQPGTPPRDMASLEPESDSGVVDRLRIDGDGTASTRLFCGRFALRRSTVHPLFSELPDAIFMTGDGSLVSWLSSSIELIDREIQRGGPGAETLTARLSDVIVLEAIRTHVASIDEGVSWLHGLQDPDVARALAIIHEQPGEPWTAAALARAVGVSRATLFRRFDHLVGMTPAAYLTRWRMHVATQLLSERGLTVSATAKQVGYRSEASFSEAFLSAVGQRPGAYRRQSLAQSA